jgi:hypothetical protein
VGNGGCGRFRVAWPHAELEPARLTSRWDVHTAIATHNPGHRLGVRVSGICAPPLYPRIDHPLPRLAPRRPCDSVQFLRVPTLATLFPD